MGKLTTICGAFMLVFSILAPSVLVIVESEDGMVTVCDHTEEENKKENKKELDEKDIFFQIDNAISAFSGNQEITRPPSYLNSYNSLQQKIILPPPEAVA